MQKSILVTGYMLPDLDGTACAIAYAEYLQKCGYNANAAFFGIPHREALFVLEACGITHIEDAQEIIEYTDEVILVDASDLVGISSSINPDKVIEIIDHRKIHDAEKFPNAKLQIELVGSAATLIAEKFHTTQTPLSHSAALLLYAAIASNTINFKAAVTTPRDIHMVSRIQSQYEIPQDFIHTMFVHKSHFSKQLREIFLDDFALFTFDTYTSSIIQLEIVQVENFLQENLQEIKSILHDLKTEHKVDILFLTCIDIEEGFNYIVTIDQKTQTILERVLNMHLQDGIGKREGILMRKQIVPLIKEFMEKTES